ncbi:MAG: hypothetical protein ACRDG4_20070 [Chloroflexota bacterium]
MVRTLEADATVTPDGQLSVQVPFTITPGKHRVVVVIDERETATHCPKDERFPSIDPGPWPSDLSLRRRDVYGDSGR